MPRKAQPWFRFYVEAVHDTKLRRLKPEVRWLFVACLAAARKSVDAGWLLVDEADPMTLSDIADFAGMPEKQAQQGMADLERVGVMKFVAEEGAWFVPNWSDRQFESDNVTARTAKHRSKKQGRNVPTSDEGTAPEKTENRGTDNRGSSSSGDSRYACIDAVDDDDDPLWIEAKDRARDYLRAGGDILFPAPFILAIVDDLKAKGWAPAIEPAPCFDPECDNGWLEGGDGLLPCRTCKPWVADYLMEARN